MKKAFIFIFGFFLSNLSASDPISIDSLFKYQLGFRSVTGLSFLSSGNSNVYTSYPNLVINGDPIIWNDTKQLNLNQTFIYAINDKFDILVSFGGSYKRSEYTNYFTYEPKSKTNIKFNSTWVGFNYKANRIGDLIPMITFQTAVYQQESARGEYKDFNFKSYSLKTSLKGYTDPVVYSIYIGIGYNKTRNFSFAKIEYGQNIYFGGDLSIILSPKITLDLGIEQGFQTEQKINNRKITNLRSIPTYSVGSTYSLNSNTALSFSASLGGSSTSPDSIFGISLWKKF